MKKIEYLTTENVEDLHDLALERDGGFPGREPGKLESKLALPMSGFGDYERFPTIPEKAAVYHYHLATGHCFFDGNKRTSFLATGLFLRFNGHELIATDDEVVDWTLRIANHENRPDFEHAVRWITDRIHDL
ncbi:type II toxin-antitoxin system death-on-curing family toxin [Rhodococcus sp. IEGM1300]